MSCFPGDAYEPLQICPPERRICCGRDGSKIAGLGLSLDWTGLGRTGLLDCWTAGLYCTCKAWRGMDSRVCCRPPIGPRNGDGRGEVGIPAASATNSSVNPKRALPSPVHQSTSPPVHQSNQSSGWLNCDHHTVRQSGSQTRFAHLEGPTLFLRSTPSHGRKGYQSCPRLYSTELTLRDGPLRRSPPSADEMSYWFYSPLLSSPLPRIKTPDQVILPNQDPSSFVVQFVTPLVQ